MCIVEKIRQKNENYRSSPIPTIVFLGDSVTHGCFEVIEGAKGTLEVVCDFEAVYHNQFKKSYQWCSHLLQLILSMQA